MTTHNICFHGEIKKSIDMFLIKKMPYTNKKSALYGAMCTHWCILTLVLLSPDIPCLCKQCRSRSVGF